MEFVYKICFTRSIISFVNVCADRGCASYYLIDKNPSAFASVNLVTDGYYM